MRAFRFAILSAALLAAAAAAANAQAVDCGCEAGPVPTVWASFNGINITAADVKPEVQAKIAAAQAGVVEARKRELDYQVNSRVLEMEAAKLKLTTTKLLENEIVNKLTAPTAAEIEAYYNANRAKIESQTGRPVTLDEIRTQISEVIVSDRHVAASKVYAEKLRTAYGAKKMVDEAPLPAGVAGRMRVLAEIGSTKIRGVDIENALLPVIYSTQKQVYRLRMDAVDLAINDRLLAAEAAKRGVTPKALLDEAKAKVPAVTEEQALKFYTENKERINGDFAGLKQQIIDFLRDERLAAAETEFAESLRRAANVKVFLTPPAAPSYEFRAEGHASKGPAAAPVTLTVFTDYQCPSCARTAPDLGRIVSEYKDKVRIVYFNYPLEMHADAAKAAEAAEAARAQGKYDEYTAMLYKNQSQLSVAKLKEYATSLGLDRKRFDADLDSGKYAFLVDADLQKGRAVGVSGTPSIFVNGSPIDSIEYMGIKQAVDAALKP